MIYPAINILGSTNSNKQMQVNTTTTTNTKLLILPALCEGVCVCVCLPACAVFVMSPAGMQDYILLTDLEGFTALF